MNFYPLYEGLNNYFITKRCNHERLKKHFARPWGNEGLVYYLHVIREFQLDFWVRLQVRFLARVVML